MNGRELRTRFAVRAIDFAETFNAGLGAMSIQPGAYRPQLTAPDGPSTGGGVQAVQHVRLVAARQGFPSILVGSANQRFGTAELRSYEYIDAVHRERWRRPVPSTAPTTKTSSTPRRTSSRPTSSSSPSPAPPTPSHAARRATRRPTPRAAAA